MVRIAPVRLSFNPKTLWFDAGDLELSSGDAVVVETARGNEFGHLSDRVFDMEYEETKRLKSPLKPVKRIATDDDIEQARRMEELSEEALPAFRELAADAAVAATLADLDDGEQRTVRPGGSQVLRCSRMHFMDRGFRRWSGGRGGDRRCPRPMPPRRVA